MKLKNKFFNIYITLLIPISFFVVLDTFVIPKAEVTVESNTSSIVEDIDSSVTSNSYTDENISISIKTARYYNTDVHIVDITLSSIDYLKTAFANNTYGRNIKKTTSEMAESNNAILAINGDYYGFRNYGFVIRNNVLYRETSNNNDDLVIYQDGSFEIIDENKSDANTLLNNGALQVFSFGPALINNSEITVNENTEVEMAKTSNPRTAIGIIDNLHYIFIVSDGRTSDNDGLTLYELAEIFEIEGCKVAYNLDGGGSSTLWFNGEIINIPTDGNKIGERSVSDIVYIGY